MSTFRLDFIVGNDIDDHNPYHIIDGKWGGFGPPLWFRFKEISETNVFEKYHGKGFNYSWGRVWDNDILKWRDITPEEHAKLPSLVAEGKKAKELFDWQNSPECRITFSKIMFPVINKVFPALITSEILSVQPMSAPTNI